MTLLLPYLILAFEIYILFTILLLLLDNREPSETFAWIFIFIMLPGVGLVLYFLFGHDWKKSYDPRKKEPQIIAKRLLGHFKALNDKQPDLIKKFKNPRNVYQDDLMTLLYRTSHALITTDNRVKVFHSGREKFDQLLEDIRQARSFVHLEYFIWYSNDALGKKLKKLLIEKAAEGVEVRILYDYSGCFFTLGRGYVRGLRKAGVQIYPFFNYLSSFKLHTLNYRNHRKIAVIDGNIAYTGGMNVGQEYIDGGKRYKSWRDTHMRLEGDAVNILQAMFAVDWFNTASDETVFERKYFPNLIETPKPAGGLPAQFPTSGFDSPWPSIQHLFFAMITEAQKSISIVTPYFIPDISLLTALKTAAMRGIKVTVLMTGVPDNLITHWAAHSYFEDVLRSGVKIFQYQKGFMHAKMFTADGEVCSIGTANFDMRSFKLNYEVNAVFYNTELTAELDAQIAEDLKACKEILLSDIKSEPVFFRLRYSLARLVANLL